MLWPEESDDHRALRNAVWKELPSWTRFIIAIDGRDGSGKSSLARYLAWQLGMPAIELDTFRDLSANLRAIRLGELQKAISSRLSRNRPVIVEGIFVLEPLQALDLNPDFLVIASCGGHLGSDTLREEFEAYEAKFRPQGIGPHLFRWSPATQPVPQTESPGH